MERIVEKIGEKILKLSKGEKIFISFVLLIGIASFLVSPGPLDPLAIYKYAFFHYTSSPRLHLYELSLLSLIIFSFIRIAGKWNYWTIAISFTCGTFIGLWGSLWGYLDLYGLIFVWFLPLAWYVSYKTFKETLKLEVKKGSKPLRVAWFVVIVGVFAPSLFLLTTTFPFIITSFGLYGSIAGFLSVTGPLIIIYLIYKFRINPELSSLFQESLFDTSKYSILIYGFLCNLLIFIIGIIYFFSYFI